ncbi:MAG TPA: hypothetical protein VGB55_05510 [Tepidisphaeraceae bacterium]
MRISRLLSSGLLLIGFSAVLAEEEPAAGDWDVSIVRTEVYVEKAFGGRRVHFVGDKGEVIERALREVELRNVPSTQPAELLANAAVRQKVLVERLQEEFVTLEQNKAEQLVEVGVLEPLRRAFDEAEQDLQFIVGEADQIEVRRRALVAAAAERHGAPAARPVARFVPVIISERDSPAAQQATIRRTVLEVEAAQAAAVRASMLSAVLEKLSELVESGPLSDLPSDNGVRWFKEGVAQWTAIEVIALVSGTDERALVEARLLAAAPAAPPLSAIDLTSPLPDNSLRPERVRAYRDACRRKALAMVFMLQRSDEAALKESLAAVRTFRPADGVTLSDVVKAATKLDMLRMLRSQS